MKSRAPLQIQSRHREAAMTIARLGLVTPAILAGERNCSTHAAREILRELSALGLVERHEGAEPQNPNYRLTAEGKDLARKGWLCAADGAYCACLFFDDPEGVGRCKNCLLPEAPRR
jgi:predicted transcriptional regulator